MERGINAQSLEFLRPFARMIAEELAKMQKPEEEPEIIEGPVGDRKLKGIPGIMEIFKCSRSHATRIRNSGMIDNAIIRVSPRVFLVDERKALEVMDKKKKGGRRY